MADHASIVFFHSGRFDLGAAASALADRGLKVRWRKDELVVHYGTSPELRIALVREPYVQQEAAEIGEGTPHAAAMARCGARFEILIDDLDAVLDEINTLIDVQITLQEATQGFLINTWNGRLSAPSEP